MTTGGITGRPVEPAAAVPSREHTRTHAPTYTHTPQLLTCIVRSSCATLHQFCILNKRSKHRDTS